MRKRAVITLAKCWHYDPIDRSGKENCGNCHHWDSVETKCWDHALLKERQYEESKAFNAMDRMMRQNKGVRLD